MESYNSVGTTHCNILKPLRNYQNNSRRNSGIHPKKLTSLRVTMARIDFPLQEVGIIVLL